MFNSDKIFSECYDNATKLVKDKDVREKYSDDIDELIIDIALGFFDEFRTGYNMGQYEELHKNDKS